MQLLAAAAAVGNARGMAAGRAGGRTDGQTLFRPWHGWVGLHLVIRDINLQTR